jgi:hypothetical protein
MIQIKKIGQSSNRFVGGCPGLIGAPCAAAFGVSHGMVSQKNSKVEMP